MFYVSAVPAPPYSNQVILPFRQEGPSHLLVHWHTLGEVHVPPFQHGGLQTAV